MRLFTWDEDGNRVSYDIPYHPYYYVETNNKRADDKISLFNTPLRKVEFPNEYRRRESIQKQIQSSRSSGVTNPVRVFENINTLQQFLVDRYWDQNSTSEFSANPIKIAFVDIETYSPDAFPNPSLANDTVNVITVYDSISKHFYTWGLGKYKPKVKDVTYINCSSERELLVNFIDHIKSDYPDILSGWNSELFDIPYLVNRIQRVLYGYLF